MEPSEVRLVAPYGGKLVNLVVAGEERDEIIGCASSLPSLQLSPRSLCDIELLAVGAFSPVDRFMGQRDYASVLEKMRLSNGAVFPIPITLPVTDASMARKSVALRSAKNDLIAVTHIEEVFEWDWLQEARQVCGTTDTRHPLVAEMAGLGRFKISGPLKIVDLPRHSDFMDVRKSPVEVRDVLSSLGRPNVVGFHANSRPSIELTRKAAEQFQGSLLIHFVGGLAKSGDVDHFARVREYQRLLREQYHPSRAVLSLLPLATRMAGPREALWHGIIGRNYGANHFMVDRDHASPGKDSYGKPFYMPYDAQELFKRHEAEVGVRMIAFGEIVRRPGSKRHVETGRVSSAAAPPGNDTPENETRSAEPSTQRESAGISEQGFCVWFTGLSGAGKSTIAEFLAGLLMELGRQVTILDGDVVRTHLSKGLGFSKEDRDTNIRRIGFVASEIVRHRGAVVCAAVSPYRATRSEARVMVGPERFIEVYVDTPIEVCESRDVKGMYAKARRGEIQGFTGIDDPYEPPLDPELHIETTESTPEENAYRIVRYLVTRGLLRKSAGDRNDRPE